MDPKPELIREDIDETRSALTEKLETLEGQLRGTVESAKQTVEGTIENVKDSIRSLSPVYQTTQRPYLMVGGAMATGYLAGRLLQPKVSGRRPAIRVATATRHEAPLPPPTSEYEETFSARRSTAGRPTILDRLADQFSDEIQMVKGMILKGVLDATSDALKRSAPKWGSQIDQVLGSMTQKLTEGPHHSSGGIPRRNDEHRHRGF